MSIEKSTPTKLANVEEALLRKIRTAFAEMCMFVQNIFGKQMSTVDIFAASIQKEFVGQGTCTGRNVFAYGYSSPEL